MDRMNQIRDYHPQLVKFSMTFVYGIIISIAVNLFLTPGHIYSSGLTGLAQLLTTICEQHAIPIKLYAWIFVLNVPLFILAWQKLGREFTIYTFLNVIFSSFMLKLIQPYALIHDPLVCAIFGGAINGWGIGLTLKEGISTGGVDIISLVIRKYYDKSIGTINIIFNSCIILAAGLMFGWPYAFYTLIGAFVTSKTIDSVYTPQKKVQVIMVTTQPQKILNVLRQKLHHGVTIINGAEGGYAHGKETILLTIISRFELTRLESLITQVDPNVFVSISDNVHTVGSFVEP